MDPIRIMVDDLARQVAEKAVQLAEWKARALTAEEALRQIESEESAEDEEA